METRRPLAAKPAQSWHDAVFASCPKPTLFGQNSQNGKWYLCRIQSKDMDGTYTIAWEDGTLQIGTQYEHLQRPACHLEPLIETQMDKATVLKRETSSYPAPVHNDTSIWKIDAVS